MPVKSLFTHRMSFHVGTNSAWSIHPRWIHSFNIFISVLLPKTKNKKKLICGLTYMVSHQLDWQSQKSTSNVFKQDFLLDSLQESHSKALPVLSKDTHMLRIQYSIHVTPEACVSYQIWGWVGIECWGDWWPKLSSYFPVFLMRESSPHIMWPSCGSSIPAS